MRLAWSDKGQSLVEFALVMPLLLVMLLGIMEFGRAWHISQIVTDAARQGARAGAIYRQADSVNAAAGRVIGAGAINGCGNISACVDYSTVGDQSIVEVHVPFWHRVEIPRGHAHRVGATNASVSPMVDPVAGPLLRCGGRLHGSPVPSPEHSDARRGGADW
jgi:TadE-like protein